MAELEKEMTDKYSYIITWSSKDEEWIGQCIEFPSLSWLAPEARDSLAGIQDVVTLVVADMKSNGEIVPEPLTLEHIFG